MTAPRSAPQAISWPKSPYKGLSYYGPGDRPLYAGRDADIRRCSALLVLPETRTVILHGKTGCGKSSFLRAGLIPTVESEGFGFEFLRQGPGQSPTVVFIRSTAAPLQRLIEQVYELVNTRLEVPTPIGTRSIDLRDTLGNTTSNQEFCTWAAEEGVLIGVLKQIASRVSKTLIIVLDQAEEVLTLNPIDDPSEHRARFFTFLQEFNSLSLDIKLVIALRTEYYGRFFSAMNIDYRVRSDAKEYLLEDLNEDMLVEAIVRPTVKTDVPPWAVPFERYRFEFEPGLPQTIAKHLLEAKQTGGVLPVMQIVCKSLFDEIDKGSQDRIISTTQYERHGRVEGRVNGHIRESLRSAFLQQSLPAKKMEEEEEKWRVVLCKLAALQEDGSVTTNVLPVEVLIDEAQDQKTRLRISDVLEHLASPDVLLLRNLSLIEANTNRPVRAVSLGHDVIGLSLNDWRAAHEEHQKHKLQLKRFYAIGVGIVTAVLVAFLAYFLNQQMLKKAVLVSNAERIARLAKAQGPADFQLGLLLALAADRLLADAGHTGASPFANDALTEALSFSPNVSLALWPTSNVPDWQTVISTLVSRQRLLVIKGGIGREAIEVDLRSITPRVSRPKVDIPNPQQFYFSRDGQTILGSSDESIQVTANGSADSVPVKTFLKSVRGAPPLSRVIPFAFGRERFGLYRSSFPNFFGGETVWPLIQQQQQADKASLLFTAERALESRSLQAGNDFLLLLIAPAGSRGSAIELLNFETGRSIPLYSADAGVWMEEALTTDPKNAPSVKRILPVSIAFAPDDAQVAFLTRKDERLSVVVAQPDWVTRKRSLLELRIHDAEHKPTGLAVSNSREGLRIAMTAGEGPIYIAEANAGRLQVLDKLHATTGLNQISFTQDATRLAAVSTKGQLLVWDLPIGAKRQSIQRLSDREKIEQACRIAARHLTKQEMEQYVGSDQLSPVCPPK